MGIVELLLVILVLCLLLWIVNASGWMALPPPFIWVFNCVVLLAFVLMVLSLTGLWHVHDFRIGGG